MIVDGNATMRDGQQLTNSVAEAADLLGDLRHAANFHVSARTVGPSEALAAALQALEAAHHRLHLLETRVADVEEMMSQIFGDNDDEPEIEPTRGHFTRPHLEAEEVLDIDD